MGRLLITFLMIAVAVVAVADAWHEDPRGDLVKNVYFTNKLNNYRANQGMSLKLTTIGRFRYRLDAKSTQQGSTPGIVQDIAVVPGRRYRLLVRGSVVKPARAGLYVGYGSKNIVWAPQKSGLPTGTPSERYADFLVPKGVTKVAVGVLITGAKKGDGFSLEWISVRPFVDDWLANPNFAKGSTAGWKALGAATIGKASNTEVSVVARSNSNGWKTKPVGIVQQGVKVVPGRRYRIHYKGGKATNAAIFPRVYRTADNGFIAGPQSMAKMYLSLPGPAKVGERTFDFTVPEGTDRVNIAVAFVSSDKLPKFKNGERFKISMCSLRILPNLIDNGDLDEGVRPWTGNGKTTVAASVDAGDRSLTATLQTNKGTPGIRIDRVPVVPGTKYHFAANARTISRGSAYLWIQEPNGEDLHWIYKNGFSASRHTVVQSTDFVAPRKVTWVNLGVLFASHPKAFRSGDRLIMHSAMLTGGSTTIGRPPTPPVRPIPPPPPPPKVIPPPAPAKKVEPPPWTTILGTKPTATLTDNVAEAVENVYKLHPECNAKQFAFIKSIKPHEFKNCATTCETTFYGKGEPGDPRPYTNYRVCHQCCADLLDQYDGISATGTAGRQWRPLEVSMLDSQAVINYAMKYTVDEAGRLTITGTSTARGCGHGPGNGFILFIKGDWTKIQYTEHFKGSASCSGVFGSNAYHYLGKLRNGLLPFSSSLGDAIYDTHKMGSYNTHTFNGRVTRCDNNRDNWWHIINGRGERRATVNLRRDPKATRAGVSTGTSCSSAAQFTITDVYVWE